VEIYSQILPCLDVQLQVVMTVIDLLTDRTNEPQTNERRMADRKNERTNGQRMTDRPID